MVRMPDVPFIPTQDFVLIKEMPQNTTAGGIAMPDGVQTEPPRGLVIAVGPGSRSAYTAELIPNDIRVGQVVWLMLQLPIPPTPMEFDGKKYIVVRASAITGICRQAPDEIGQYTG